MRDKHSKKEVEAVLVYAEEHGWVVEKRKGHAWGILRCPHNDKDCRCGKYCQMSIWSTPKNPGNFANTLQTRIDRCIYENGDDNGDV